MDSVVTFFHWVITIVVFVMFVVGMRCILESDYDRWKREDKEDALKKKKLESENASRLMSEKIAIENKKLEERNYYSSWFRSLDEIYEQEYTKAYSAGLADCHGIATAKVHAHKDSAELDKFVEWAITAAKTNLHPINNPVVRFHNKNPTPKLIVDELAKNAKYGESSYVIVTQYGVEKVFASHHGFLIVRPPFGDKLSEIVEKFNNAGLDVKIVDTYANEVWDYDARTTHYSHMTLKKWAFEISLQQKPVHVGSLTHGKI